MRNLVGLRVLAMSFGSMVHQSALNDPVTAAVHRTFIVWRFFAGLLTVCLFPVFLGFGGAAEKGLVGLFALAIAPIVSALILVQTGSLKWASWISALVIGTLVVVIAVPTGGLASPYVIWMLLVPLDVALSRNKGAALAASILAGAAIAFLSFHPGFVLETAWSIYGKAPWQVVLVFGAAMAYLAVTIRVMWSREREILSLLRTDTMRHRLLAENATDMVSRHDPSGRARYVSPAAARLLGLPGSALTGKRWIDHIHPADLAGFRAAMQRVSQEGREASFEFRMRRARLAPIELRDYASQDDYVWVEMRCRPTLDDEGLNGDVVAVTRDIMARKTHDRMLESARIDAERANQAKTRFLANVSHELRTPLNAIIGFSDLLKTGVHGPLGHPSNTEYVNMINDSGNHLLQLVNEILDMSKLEAGRYEIFREPFDLETLLTGCTAMMSVEADRKGVHVSVHVPRGSPEANADKRAVKQMVLNLMSNALKFTPKGGRIELAADVSPDSVTISVRDTGMGIKPDVLSRLGKPFVQADTTYSREHEGTGLGLSVVRGLAELHDGHYTIESTPGLGTVVTIHLPHEPALSRKPAPAETIAPMSEETPDLRQARTG